MATEPRLTPALIIIKTLPAPTARNGIVIDDLIDLILRAQFATNTLVTRLPTRLAPFPL